MNNNFEVFLKSKVCDAIPKEYKNEILKEYTDTVNRIRSQFKEGKKIDNQLKQYEAITITMKNGNTATWNKGEWSDYRYDGKCFVVILNDAWIGFYNIDEVYTIVVE